jgi:hypothetical protein
VAIRARRRKIRGGGAAARAIADGYSSHAMDSSPRRIAAGA